jgi:hypothetical protein
MLSFFLLIALAKILARLLAALRCILAWYFFKALILAMRRDLILAAFALANSYRLALNIACLLRAAIFYARTLAVYLLRALAALIFSLRAAAS